MPGDWPPPATRTEPPSEKPNIASAQAAHQGDPPVTAVILCEGAFGTSNGKTAHGLIRVSRRYKIIGVIDSTLARQDAGEVLDGKRRNIPIFATLEDALMAKRPDYLIIGVATDGGRLPPAFRPVVTQALERGILVVNGLHEFLSEKPEFERLAIETGAGIVDVRKDLGSFRHFFSGEIELVGAVRIPVLGTDSAIGKRTTTILLTEECNRRGISAIMIGTGQTAWMQGVSEYCIALDSLVNDYVSGTIEATIVRAWKDHKPDVIFVEGQGSITHPAYPGGFEIIAGSRPHGIVLQHAPGRRTLDGFPAYPMPSLDREIQILELLSQRKIVAITLNSEGLTPAETTRIASEYEKRYKVASGNVLTDGPGHIVDGLVKGIPALSAQGKRKKRAVS